MCYDVSFSTSIESIYDYFPDIVHDDQIRINFQSAVHIQGHAYGEYPVVYQSREDGRLHLKLMEWGCMPFYVKDEKAFARQRPTMLNARSERILDDAKSYWYKIRERRCLVPVTGIYEHREVKGFKTKIPYFIKVKSEKLVFLPGLYSVVELPDKDTGELVKRFTYTVVTRAANSVMRAIHNGGENAGRMPLFLPFAMAQEWLFDLSESRYREILSFEMPSEQLEYWPVNTIRGPKAATREDGTQKNDPFVWPGLPELELT